MSTNPSTQEIRQKIADQFLVAIDQYQNGSINSRGLAKLAEKTTTSTELAHLDDELLSHAFWAMRHLLHQPACWAAKPAELEYLTLCLRGEDDFDQAIVDRFRED